MPTVIMSKRSLLRHSGHLEKAKHEDESIRGRTPRGIQIRISLRAPRHSAAWMHR